MLHARSVPRDAVHVAFLTTTALTSATGYGFPFDHLLPSHIVGALSLLMPAVAALALYGRHLDGPWKRFERCSWRVMALQRTSRP